jgi:hypothetical protein
MHGAETLVFDDLAPHLLLRNGNFLYKIPFRGGFAVVKVYRGSRGPLETLRKSLQNRASGQTSYRARTRLRVERECLDAWRKQGFRVYDTFDDVVIDAPQCPPGSYAVFEYRKGPSLNEHLADASLPEDARFATWRRFLLEWGRRHALAIELRDTRLVHENGDGKHVMVFDDGFLWLDFEVIWTDAARISEHVSHEIVQYLWQISKSIPEPLRPRLLRETASHYPDRDRLRDAWRLFLAHPRPLMRAARRLDRRTPRGRKPTSKYAVAERLRALIEAP